MIDSLLIDLHTFDSGLQFDIRYATPYNFTGQVLYPSPLCYLRQEAAYALNKAQKELAKQGLGLKIFDGYRPLSVQKKMWDLVQDERYVSNPEKNKGRHTRGTAVDLTLVDAKGRELEMPTPFDEFSERAHCSYSDLSETAKRNRTLLRSTMESVGFIPFEFEWWHFDWQGWNDDTHYPSLDISFEELKSVS